MDPLFGGGSSGSGRHPSQPQLKRTRSGSRLVPDGGPPSLTAGGNVTVHTFDKLVTELAGRADTILLAPGVYKVTQTLDITRNVSLVADGLLEGGGAAE